MTLMDYAKANVRTIVPFIVGWLITFALKHGVDLHGYQAAVTVVVGAVYYAAVRLLERYVTPRFGWLLGLAQQPVYAKVRTRKDKPVPRSPSKNATSLGNHVSQSTLTVNGGGGGGGSNASVTIGAGGLFVAPSVHNRLAFLPKPSGRKGGALPSPRDDRDYKAKLPTRIPASVDNGAGITWGMLLNDRIGDCYPAALLHALQVLTGYTPVDADALAIYEQVTGYDPTRTDANGNNPTDQGTYGRQLFDWARKQGLVDTYAAVPANRQAVRAAIASPHKVALCEWALPTGVETEGDIWTMPRKGRTPGSWGGHATVETGYTPTRNRNVTWGEYGTVTPAFEDAYLQAAWVVTVKPGVDVAAIMAKVRAA